jgi:hypothetical protein
MALTQEQAAVRLKFAAEVEADSGGYLELYRQKFGKVLDTDNARELSADYARSAESRARLSGSVHETAGTLVWRLWLEMLAEPDPAGLNRVLITAGGAGAGKTSTVTRLSRDAYDAAQIIYDTTLADLPSAVEKIEAALAAGKSVTVAYIHRPIEMAVRGVIQRATATGRTVPLTVLADNHFDAQRSVREIAARYEENPLVEVIIINNSGMLEEASFARLDFLLKRFYKKRTAVRRRAARAARAEFRRLLRAGREAPQYVYEGILEEERR